MNGGPGCSSLLGFLTEHGPFKVKDDGVNLEPNPYAWNNITNMIYLEAPAGVGFSYSADKNYSINDDEVARDNHLALQDFFSKFPEYRENDFYITGESYGGIYVPTLSSLVLDDPNINLKGFAVGNGLSDDDMNDNSLVYFAYYHGLIGSNEWRHLLRECCPKNESRIWCDFVAGSRRSQQCALETNKIFNLVWSSGLNVYNLYSECAGGAKDLNLYYDASRGKYVTSNFGWPFMFLKSNVVELKQILSSIPANKLAASPPCTNDTITIKYLNSPATRTALHIPANVQAWDVCSSAVGAGYVRTYSTMTAQYQKALSRKIRILVYNGDVDMACNFLGDEWFADSLNATILHDRKFWFYKEVDGTTQIAGFVKTFDNLAVVTIKGSGHMVPTDKPIPALDMYTKFIHNKPF
uniref:Carboxypeptidase n=1 Tax=Arion vulgaris TaxID=1028688 RepID=A0A0B7A322_9EUPU